MFREFKTVHTSTAIYQTDTVAYLLARRQQYVFDIYEGHLESKEHFAIKKYLLIIGKKKNMQVLSHTFTYFST